MPWLTALLVSSFIGTFEGGMRDVWEEADGYVFVDGELEDNTDSQLGKFGELRKTLRIKHARRRRTNL